jgi:TonB family protein
MLEPPMPRETATRWRYVNTVLLLALLFCCAMESLHGNDRMVPSEFYIVSEVTSDASPFWYHYILQVTREDRDSVVRYIRIAPMDSMCAESITVKAVTVRLPGVSPSDLAARYNLCGVDPVSFNRNLQRRIRTAAIDDSVRFNIVATCGSEPSVFHLPYPEQVNLERLRKSSPELARWWGLRDVIKERAFGPGQLFYDVSSEQEEKLQQDGEIMVPVLRSGHFDKGLLPDCTPGQPCNPRSFGDELLGYVGPVGFRGYEPRLIQADEYRFKRYVLPKYPPLAIQARIQGKVKLELSVDANTGDVREVRVVLGHAIFLDAVKQAVRQWVFAEYPRGEAQSLPVELVFDWHCPETLAQ